MSLEAEDWGAIAAVAGFPDTGGVTRCVQKQTYATTVGADMRAAETLHAIRTPLVIADGWLLASTPNVTDLEARLVHGQ
jgi:hypothetical protein